MRRATWMLSIAPLVIFASCALPSLRAGTTSGQGGASSAASSNSSGSSASASSSSASAGGASTASSSTSGGAGAPPMSFQLDEAIVVKGDDDVHLHAVATAKDGTIYLAGSIDGAGKLALKGCDMVNGTFLLRFDPNGQCAAHKPLNNLTLARLANVPGQGLYGVGVQTGMVMQGMMCNQPFVGVNASLALKTDPMSLDCTAIASFQGSGFSGIARCTQCQGLWVLGNDGVNALARLLSYELSEDLANDMAVPGINEQLDGQSVAAAAAPDQLYLGIGQSAGGSAKGELVATQSNSVLWTEPGPSSASPAIERVASLEDGNVVAAYGSSDGTTFGVFATDMAHLKKTWSQTMSGGDTELDDLVSCGNGKSYVVGSHRGNTTWSGAHLPFIGSANSNALVVEIDTKSGSVTRYASLGNAMSGDAQHARRAACEDGGKPVVGGVFTHQLDVPGMAMPLDAGPHQAVFLYRFH